MDSITSRVDPQSAIPLRSDCHVLAFSIRILADLTQTPLKAVVESWTLTIDSQRPSSLHQRLKLQHGVPHRRRDAHARPLALYESQRFCRCARVALHDVAYQHSRRSIYADVAVVEETLGIGGPCHLIEEVTAGSVGGGCVLVGRSQETTVAVGHFDDVVVELPADSDAVSVRGCGRKARSNDVGFR